MVGNFVANFVDEWLECWGFDKVSDKVFPKTLLGQNRDPMDAEEGRLDQRVRCTSRERSGIGQKPDVIKVESVRGFVVRDAHVVGVGGVGADDYRVT